MTAVNYFNNFHILRNHSTAVSGHWNVAVFVIALFFHWCLSQLSYRYAFPPLSHVTPPLVPSPMYPMLVDMHIVLSVLACVVRWTVYHRDILTQECIKPWNFGSCFGRFPCQLISMDIRKMLRPGEGKRGWWEKEKKKINRWLGMAELLQMQRQASCGGSFMHVTLIRRKSRGELLQNRGLCGAVSKSHHRLTPGQ